MNDYSYDDNNKKRNCNDNDNIENRRCTIVAVVAFVNVITAITSGGPFTNMD